MNPRLPIALLVLVGTCCQAMADDEAEAIARHDRDGEVSPVLVRVPQGALLLGKYELIEPGVLSRREAEIRAAFGELMEQRAARLHLERFHWNRGGALLTREMGSLLVEVGVWPKLEAVPSGDGGLRLSLDILRIRW